MPQLRPAGSAKRGRANKAANEVRPWRALLALSIGYFLIMVDQGLMPVITPHLPAEASEAVWLTSVYLLWTVVPMPVTGRLGDRFGQRPVYIAGMLMYAASLMLAATSWSWSVLVVARALQGLGSAVFLPQAFGLISRVFPADGRGKAFAAWGVIGSAGSLLGPVAGGVLVSGAGWRAAFAVQAGIALAGVLCAAVWLPTLHVAPVAIRIAPVAFIFLGLSLLVSGIQSLNSFNFVVGLAFIFGLVVSERTKGPEAFLPLSLFRNWNFTLGTLGIAAMGFTVASMFIPVMFWLQAVAGVDAAMAGALTMPMSIVAMVLTPYAGVVADTLSPRLLSTLGFGTMAAGLLGAWWLAAAGVNPMWFALVTAVLGAGSAFVWTPNATTTMRGVPEDMAGAASGVYNTLRQVGSVVGVAAVGAVMGSGGVEAASISAMLVPAAALAAGAVLSAFLRTDTSAKSR